MQLSTDAFPLIFLWFWIKSDSEKESRALNERMDAEEEE